MKLGFRALAILCALTCFALALIWMLSPGLLLSMWDVDPSDGAGLVGRRGAALLLGIGVMFYRARNLAPSRARHAIVCGFVCACLALATLGVFELVSGHAGLGIVATVLTELAIALLFISAARAERTVS